MYKQFKVIMIFMTSCSYIVPDITASVWTSFPSLGGGFPGAFLLRVVVLLPVDAADRVFVTVEESEAGALVFVSLVRAEVIQCDMLFSE